MRIAVRSPLAAVPQNASTQVSPLLATAHWFAPSTGTALKIGTGLGSSTWPAGLTRTKAKDFW